MKKAFSSVVDFVEGVVSVCRAVMLPLAILLAAYGICLGVGWGYDRILFPSTMRMTLTTCVMLIGIVVELACAGIIVGIAVDLWLPYATKLPGREPRKDVAVAAIALLLACIVFPGFDAAPYEMFAMASYMLKIGVAFALLLFGVWHASVAIRVIYGRWCRRRRRKK